MHTRGRKKRRKRRGTGKAGGAHEAQSGGGWGLDTGRDRRRIDGDGAAGLTRRKGRAIGIVATWDGALFAFRIAQTRLTLAGEGLSRIAGIADLEATAGGSCAVEGAFGVGDLGTTDHVVEAIARIATGADLWDAASDRGVRGVELHEGAQTELSRATIAVGVADIDTLAGDQVTEAIGAISRQILGGIAGCAGCGFLCIWHLAEGLDRAVGATCHRARLRAWAIAVGGALVVADFDAESFDGCGLTGP